jgi:methylmalonyl-CoA mutase cobalamin-binding subunit
LRSGFPQPTKNATIAVGGAPEKDPFVLPSLMVSTVLAELGYQPVNLGPNTPIEVIARAAVDLDAPLVWISLTSPLPRGKLNNDLEQAALHLKRYRKQLVLGGQVASRYQAPAGKHVHLFPSLAEMAGFARAAATVD